MIQPTSISPIGGYFHRQSPCYGLGLCSLRSMVIDLVISRCHVRVLCSVALQVLCSWAVDHQHLAIRHRLHELKSKHGMSSLACICTDITCTASESSNQCRPRFVIASQQRRSGRDLQVGPSAISAKATPGHVPCDSCSGHLRGHIPSILHPLPSQNQTTHG
jgi:hypothetical protein